MRLLVTIFIVSNLACQTSQSTTTNSSALSRNKSQWQINWNAVEDKGLKDQYRDEAVTKEAILGNAQNLVTIACVLTKANQGNVREFLYTTMIGLETTGYKRFGKNWPKKRDQIQLLMLVDGTTLTSMEQLLASQLISDRANNTLKDLSESLKKMPYPRSFDDLRRHIRIVRLDSTDSLAEFYLRGSKNRVAFSVIDSRGGFTRWGSEPWNEVKDTRGLAYMVNTVLKQLQ